MGFVEEGRQPDLDSLDPEFLAIEARISAAERQVEALEIRKYGRRAEVDELFESLDQKIDRNHFQIMDTLQKMETACRLQILERLARLESKFQNVA